MIGSLHRSLSRGGKPLPTLHMEPKQVHKSVKSGPNHLGAEASCTPFFQGEGRLVQSIPGLGSADHGQPPPEDFHRDDLSSIADCFDRIEQPGQSSLKSQYYVPIYNKYGKTSSRLRVLLRFGIYFVLRNRKQTKQHTSVTIHTNHIHHQAKDTAIRQTHGTQTKPQ
jgi:hypothetical protein